MIILPEILLYCTCEKHKSNTFQLLIALGFITTASTAHSTENELQAQYSYRGKREEGREEKEERKKRELVKG